MSQNFESVLNAVRQLPLEEQRQLAAQIMAEVAHTQTNDSKAQAALTIVEETYGSMKGLDRDTLIRFAEDEEFCGY